MKICLVATFPPSGRQLNEYAFYIARELQRNPRIELTILADELTDYEFATDQNGNPIKASEQAELPGFNVIRCWKFNSLGTPVNLLKTIRRLKPDVVWFNLVFSSFATPDYPVAAFAGLCVPALTRTLGCYTHITLHHIIEHVDFASAGVRQEKMFRVGSDIATRALLKANSVSVLLSGYRRTLIEKYSAENVLLGTHGTFAPCPSPPDWSKRGNPDHRVLAIGHWGTYKRLETLMEAFPAVLKKVPNCQADRCWSQSSHQTRILGIDSRFPQSWLEGRIPRLRSGRSYSRALQHDQRGGDAIRFCHRLQWSGPSGVRVRSSDRIRRYSRLSRYGCGRRHGGKFLPARKRSRSRRSTHQHSAIQGAATPNGGAELLCRHPDDTAQRGEELSPLV